MSQRISLDPTEGREKRIYKADFEIRSEEGGPSKVVGYAAMFNKRSENFGGETYPFYEIIKPGAFSSVLKDDVRALIDHSGGLQTLARTKSRTLELSEDEIGLRFEFEAPDTQAGRDIVTILKRGDIDQASFAFIVDREGQEFEEKEENGKEVTIRTITQIKRLYDVSPVTYPAYPETIVQARSMEERINQKKICAFTADNEARARTLRLLELKQL